MLTKNVYISNERILHSLIKNSSNNWYIFSAQLGGKCVVCRYELANILSMQGRKQFDVYADSLVYSHNQKEFVIQDGNDCRASSIDYWKVIWGFKKEFCEADLMILFSKVAPLNYEAGDYCW